MHDGDTVSHILTMIQCAKLNSPVLDIPETLNDIDKSVCHILTEFYCQDLWHRIQGHTDISRDMKINRFYKKWMTPSKVKVFHQMCFGETLSLDRLQKKTQLWMRLRKALCQACNKC